MLEARRNGSTVDLSAATSETRKGVTERGVSQTIKQTNKQKAKFNTTCVSVCAIHTLSGSGRQWCTLCSSLTMVMKSLSCRSSSLVLQRDRGWYCKKKEREQGVSNIFSLQYLLQCTLQKHEHKVHKQWIWEWCTTYWTFFRNDVNGAKLLNHTECMQKQ